MLVQGKFTGEFLLSEGNGTQSREEVTFVSGAALPPGQVVGKVTASDKYAAYNNAASDGTEVAVGVLYAGLPTSEEDRKGVIIVRLSEVSEEMLTGLDANGKTDLTTRGVIFR